MAIALITKGMLKPRGILSVEFGPPITVVKESTQKPEVTVFNVTLKESKNQTLIEEKIKIVVKPIE